MSDGATNIVLPVKHLAQRAGKRRYAYHHGRACAKCHGPIGRKANGEPRTDRYCATCRRNYERDRRIAAKQKHHATLVHLSKLRADISDLKCAAHQRTKSSAKSPSHPEGHHS